MDLIIVESPTKAKTISKFVGKQYKIESSFGHIRDLPRKEMGVDIGNDFRPKYIIPTKSRKAVTNLKKLAEKAETVILATDEDREGEAIAWHLSEALKLKSGQTKRIVFHEITRDAITAALEDPRDIDIKLVDAQQARRVLDRLVGYELSPFLWKKVVKGLSAGRVQSVAVRLIVERERERKNFEIEEYWSIIASLRTAKDKFDAKLNKINNRVIDKLEIKNKKQAGKILKELENAKYTVADVVRKQSKKNPPKPFITSTLQQTANRWLGFSAKQTMVIAQQLYEGIEINGESTGLITYMRTDSYNLSDKFLHEARAYLTEKFEDKYALDKPRRFKIKAKGAQEAHEAIRPTEVSLDPESIKSSLEPRQYKLYRLIWQRALASQMPEAQIDATTLDIDAVDTPYQFRATGQVITFDGYLKIYPEKSKELTLPETKTGARLDLVKLTDEQHFTKPPARYSDAGLVKALEQYGIGRPSTYAPTIATIISRNYVNRDENKRLAPTEIAEIVNDLLVEHFPRVVDYEFTARMETDLDRIAEGETDWQPVIREFYEPFHSNLELKSKELNKKDIMPEEKSDQTCDKCGASMVIKTGRYGKFLACSGFPKCKNAKPLNGENEPGNINKEKNEELKKLEEEHAGKQCEKCGSDMVVKNGKFGPFLACSGYPKCRNIKNIQGVGNINVTCPECEPGEIVQKRSRRGIFYACDQYPDCKTAFWGKPTGEKCPECSSLLIEGKGETITCSSKECEYTK